MAYGPRSVQIVFKKVLLPLRPGPHRTGRTCSRMTPVST
jgi:hypothetical protein